MQKHNNDDHRCWNCDRVYVPDPRVKERQVTCGRSECQRARHSYKCKDWHKCNAEVSAAHYEEVVKPFREKQPDYQRRWRLKCRLREIREKFDSLLDAVLPTSIRRLLGRAEALSSSPTKDEQVGVLAGDLLDKAVLALRAVVAALEPLDKGVAMLRSLGLGAPSAR